MDIAIGFLVHLGSDEFLCFFFSDIVEVDIFRYIDIERLPFEKRAKPSFSLGIGLSIIVSHWCVSGFFVLYELDGPSSIDSMWILTTRNRDK